jgi:hypothetical protein
MKIQDKSERYTSKEKDQKGQPGPTHKLAVRVVNVLIGSRRQFNVLTMRDI